MMYLKETCIKLNMQNILKATFLPLGAYKVFKFNKLMFSLIFLKIFIFLRVYVPLFVSMKCTILKILMIPCFL